MGFSDTVELDGSGSRGFIFTNIPKFKEILDPDQQFYAGSAFEVSERITIDTTVDDPKLIDVDFRWYQPRKYIGNWSALTIGSTAQNAQNSGYIIDERTEIEHRSLWTLGANIATPRSLQWGGRVNQCNFELSSTTIRVGPATIAVSRPRATQGLFGIESYKEASRITNQLYTSQFDFIGFYINPGASLVSITREIFVENHIPVDDVPWTATPCSIGGPSVISCDSQFNTFIQNSGFSLTPISLADCPARAEKLVYICPTDPLYTRTYYRCPVF